MRTLNQTLADTFFEMAERLDAEGANPYRIKAYRRAAQVLSALSEDIAAVAERGDLRQIPGIGKELSTKILEFLNTGRIQSLQDGHSPPLPSDILAWIGLPGLSERTVRLLYSRLGIRTLDDLEALAKSHFLRTLPGFGGSEPELLQAIALRRNMESDRQITPGAGL